VSEDLAGLLASGERAAFHGRPDAGVEPLRRAVEQAVSDGLGAEASAAGWLLGVCLSSAGRYGSALQILEPVATPEGEVGPELQIFAALASASAASVHRQLGRHGEARRYDEQGLARTDGSGEAAFDCLLGLAADAVGLGDKAAAQEHLAAAQKLAEGRADWWRQRVRLGWLDAEVGLLVGDGEAAAAAAEQAVDLAERSGAPRHVAKGLLFLGVAQVEVGRLDDAATALKRGGLLAESLGTLPLLWPTRALLGALLAESDPKQSTRCLASARATVETIAKDVPDDLRDEWLARPDVGAVLGG
jgi:tetratricopeptide (TPR) repeat protein